MFRNIAKKKIYGTICTVGFIILLLFFSQCQLQYTFAICEDEGKSHDIKILPHPSNGTEADGFFHEQCECWKHTGKIQFHPESSEEKSKCSKEATYVGPNQKVISYVLVDRDERIKTQYNIGHWPNLLAMRTFYPGWVMRIYSDYKLKQDIDYCYFICTNDDVFWCDINDIPEVEYDPKNIEERSWRYFVFDDPLVDYFMSRDIDSRLGLREAGAVSEWLESPFVFHIMRDDKTYHKVFLLAGMWGAKTHLLGLEERRYFLKRVMTESKKEGRSNFKDQNVISKRLYYDKFVNKILTHDDHNCDILPIVECQPFPSEFDGVHHVGSIFYPV